MNGLRVGDSLEYEDRHSLFAGKVIISYPLQWGCPCAVDRWLWLAELDGEVWDYNSRDALIEDAISNGLGVVVLRHNRHKSLCTVVKLVEGRDG